MQLVNWNLEAAWTQKSSAHCVHQGSGILWGASEPAFPSISNVLNPPIQPK